MTQAIVQPFSVVAIGHDMCAGASVNPTAGSNWPSTNRGIFVPFSLPVAATLRKVWWGNGGTLSGNADCGVYSSFEGQPKTLLVSSGATALSGTNAVQSVDVADTPLDAGVLYYMCLALGTTGDRIQRYSAPVQDLMTLMGVCQASSMMPLTSNPTIEAVGAAFLPQFGITIDATVF